ncbi:MAG: hypothetical protein JOY84_22875 [Curvibacter sp.]|nr:hypothetical protein [Curvibacter sp.]
MAQQWIVGIIVGAAGLYALWYWMPAGLRRHLGRLDRRLTQAPGCGACNSCDGCGTTTQSAQKAPQHAVGDIPAAEARGHDPIWMQQRS